MKLPDLKKDEAAIKVKFLSPTGLSHQEKKRLDGKRVVNTVALTTGQSEADLC